MAPTDSRDDDRAAFMQEEFHPALPALVAATGLIAAVYVFFLIFAQFGFLQAVQAVTGPQGARLKPIMAVMGAAGLAGSALAGWKFQEKKHASWLLGSLAVCAAAAGLTLATGTAAGLFAAAALTGLGVGTVTVALAATLRRVVGGERLGRCCGVGTGAAYAICNLPPVFTAGPREAAVFGLLAACAGMVAVQGLDPRAPAHRPAGLDYRRPGMAVWTLVFLALVWLDSAAFYIIQHTAGLQDGTWGGHTRLYANAVVHFVAALLAGYVLDRRWVGRLVFAAMALLLAACALIDRSYHAFAEGALLYTAGVSFYSAALVFYPARSGRAKLAALVYGGAGWIGSALGIGMAEDLHEVPVWFMIVAGTAVAGALAGRKFLQRRAGRMNEN